MLGYAVGAAAWLAQRGIQVLAARRANAELAAGNRQRAMAIGRRRPRSAASG